MNKEQYKVVLNEKVAPQMHEWFPRRRQKFTYMHDLAPCHRAIVIQKELEKLKIPLLEWPSNSPDMNPIENVWRRLKELVRDFLVDPQNQVQFSRLSTLDYLKVAISACWESEEIKQMAIKGAWTKY